MQKIVNALLLKIGYNDNRNENIFIKCLRQEAAKWACILDDANCKNIAYENLLSYLGEHELPK